MRRSDVGRVLGEGEAIPQSSTPIMRVSLGSTRVEQYHRVLSPALVWLISPHAPGRLFSCHSGRILLSSMTVM